MPHPDYTHEALADLPGVAFSAMRQMILAQVAAADMKVLEDEAGRLTVETAHGLVGLRPGTASETAGMVAARDPRWLFIMKDAVIQQMRMALPSVAEAMRWSDGAVAGDLPPNFQFVRVRDVAPLGAVFLRVTLEGEDLSDYRDDAIHFRLIQPPKDVEPEWPSVAPNGSARWPDGPNAPHKPVYTARYIDHHANTLVTDVFLHDGGRTTAWAQDVMAGERGRSVVGLIGPGGGGLLASDETGFPAVARLLENLPEDARGDVLLEAEDGAEGGYPVEAPAGMRIRWLARSRGKALGEAALAALSRHRDAQVWFAGEGQDARRLREAAKAAGRSAKDLRISGFWNASE